MANKKFWDGGLRFECQGTGRCCTSRGSYGFVYLTLQDRKRFAVHMSLSTQAFTRKYCQKTDGHWHLRGPEKDCEFLQNKRCTVYQARPVQCRTWPFWPENMNAKTWSKDIAQFCAGVGKGDVVSAKRIQDQLDEMKKSEIEF